MGDIPIPKNAKPGERNWRRQTTSYLLYGGAVFLAATAVLHAVRYVIVNSALTSSSLSPAYKGELRALWLGFPLQVVVLAALVLLGGLRPGSVSRIGLLLCGLLPLLNGALLAAFTERKLTPFLLIAAAASILVGAMLQPSNDRAGKA